ncbi:RHE_PE00001 family protein [Microvirga rosea]|uniref:RHE_PE00001 family protein n=1 Tax=Microvirga rosea TaxID=2715425 RepID=UPI001D0AFC8E|nr:RHE_PE00001 family protein [Microvirga rosea]MCB8823209.1 DUF1612 domain-containing protein [Microvirga rosea]
MNFSILEDQSDRAPLPVELPDLPWGSIAGPMERLLLDICHFDAKLAASGLADGWQSRCDMNDAVRALLLDGQLVDIGDLVLHDAAMDVRSPTHEITRAAAALRARRTALVRPAPWPLSIDGISALRGIAIGGGEMAKLSRSAPRPDEASELYDDDDPLAAHLADIDKLLARTDKVLAGETPIPKSRSSLIYDPEEDQAEKEDLWLDALKRMGSWPALATAAIGWDLWTSLGLYERQPWLGLIMAASILRARGVTSRLLPLASGYKASKYRPTGRETPAQKVEGFGAIVSEALRQSQKDLERLILAREAMGRATRDRRSNSKLPDFVNIFLSRPLVTVALGAKLLNVTPKAIDDMMRQLGGALPRELTGRRRYRAWGIV